MKTVEQKISYRVGRIFGLLFAFLFSVVYIKFCVVLFDWVSELLRS